MDRQPRCPEDGKDLDGTLLGSPKTSAEDETLKLPRQLPYRGHQLDGLAEENVEGGNPPDFLPFPQSCTF